MRPLRLGTRRSTLARTQSEWVAELLRARGLEVELVDIVTEGDTSRASLATIGGTGVFAAAIRRALLAGEVDLAVHSLKDLPTTPEPGLVIPAIPGREDPRDALVARDGLTLGELPVGAVVGTGSPRRRGQLAALGLGVETRDIRGNVETRIGKVRSGELDAVVLARAGLNRLGRLGDITETLDPLQVLPAPGQGALAVECRADDDEVAEGLAVIDDRDTRVCVEAERGLLRALEAGCAAPVGALAEIVDSEDGEEVSLRAVVAAVDGSAALRRSFTGRLDEAASVGRRLADVLLEDGAADITTIDAVPGGSGRGDASRRPPDQPGADEEHSFALTPVTRSEPNFSERAQ